MSRGCCSVAGCQRNAQARRLCAAHYQKWRIYGDANAGSSRAPNGAGYLDKHGYHRRSVGGVEKPEHVRIVERVLGKPLPPGAVVHHWDENKSNNTKSNLLVCPNDDYHKLIHARMRAQSACGNPNWKKCCRCLQYDEPSRLSKSGEQHYHAECNAAHAREMKRVQREKAHAALR